MEFRVFFSSSFSRGASVMPKGLLQTTTNSFATSFTIHSFLPSIVETGKFFKKHGCGKGRRKYINTSFLRIWKPYCETKALCHEMGVKQFSHNYQLPFLAITRIGTAVLDLSIILPGNAGLPLLSDSIIRYFSKKHLPAMNSGVVILNDRLQNSRYVTLFPGVCTN